MKFLRQAGFGMIEVTVALGMMGIVAYMFMKQTESSGLQQSKMAFSQSVNSFANSIQTELAKKENCSVTLSNLAVNNTITQIKEGATDPLGVVSATGKILIQVLNPNDTGGVFIDKMLYTTNTAGKDVLRVTFMAGKVDAAGVKTMRKMLGSNQINKDFIINAIKDPTTLKVTNCYSDFTNLVKTVEDKICAVETKLVYAVGGKTDNCNPQIVNDTLYLEIHTEKHCTKLGGSMVAIGAVKICRYNAANCPQGWTQYNNWSTTTSKFCSAGLDRGGSVNGNAWGTCSNNANLISHCGWGTSNDSGHHAWSDKALESKTYETMMRICWGTSNCGDHQCYNNTVGNTYVDCGYSGGGSTQQTCVANRTQIACY